MRDTTKLQKRIELANEFLLVIICNFYLLLVNIVTDKEGKRAISMLFIKDKNNKMHNGSTRLLPEQKGEVIEPLTLMLLFFQKVGFTMGKGEDFLNCRSSGSRANGRYPLSYTTAMEDGKRITRELGFTDVRYGETSAKRLGASNARQKTFLWTQSPMSAVAETNLWWKDIWLFY